MHMTPPPPCILSIFANHPHTVVGRVSQIVNCDVTENVNNTNKYQDFATNYVIYYVLVFRCTEYFVLYEHSYCCVLVQRVHSPQQQQQYIMKNGWIHSFQGRSQSSIDYSTPNKESTSSHVSTYSGAFSEGSRRDGSNAATALVIH